MPKKKQRSTFWVVSTHVLTTSIVMPLLTGLSGAMVILAMQPPPLASYLLVLAFGTIGYVGGVFYSLSYIEKVAIVQNPLNCIKPSIVTFCIVTLLSVGFSIYLRYSEVQPDLNPTVVAISDCAFAAVICVIFAWLTHVGFSRMAAAQTSPESNR